MRKLFGLLFILVGILIVWKMFLPEVHLGNWTSLSGQQSVSAPVSGVDAIEIKGKAANVHIVARKQSNLTAELKGNGKLSIHNSNHQVKINIQNRWVDWLPIGKQTALYVYVPESYTQSLKINLHAGDVVMNGKAGGSSMDLKDLSIQMDAGNLKLSDLHVRNFTDNGSAGDIHIDRFKSHSSDFQLSAGDVELNHFSGKLEVSLSAGQLKAQMDQLSAPVDVNVSAGNVVLDLPNDAGMAIDAQVSTGKASCDFPLEQTTMNADHHIKGIHGSGKPPVTIRVSMGDIQIN